MLLLLLMRVLPVAMDMAVLGRRVVLLAAGVVLGRAAADLQGRGLHRVAVVWPLSVGDESGPSAGGASARAWK